MTTKTGMTGSQGAPLITLLEEMQALFGILPANIAASAAQDAAAQEGRAEVVATEQDAVVEAGFDNMPV